MRTICFECKHYQSHYHIRGEGCTAPGWERSIDFVTGQVHPKLMGCELMNKGNCEHFSPKPESLTRRIWNIFLLINFLRKMK